MHYEVQCIIFVLVLYLVALIRRFFTSFLSRIVICCLIVICNFKCGTNAKPKFLNLNVF